MSNLNYTFTRDIVETESNLDDPDEKKGFFSLDTLHTPPFVQRNTDNSMNDKNLPDMPD